MRNKKTRLFVRDRNLFLSKLNKLVKDPYYAIGNFLYRYCPKHMPDKWFIQVQFKKRMGYKLNLNHPRSFNEKLQWLKLYNRKPEYSEMVDKYQVNQWVSDTIGPQYVIPTIAVFSSVDEIIIDNLPDQFVLKCTHDSGSVVICNNRSSFDLESSITFLNDRLHRCYYQQCREWPYRNVKPRIIAEPFMASGEESNDLIDYKFFCFDGVVKVMYVATDRHKLDEDVKFDFYDAEFNHLDIKQGHENAKKMPQKPRNFDLMKRLVSKLSKGIPQVRVDFYEVGRKVFFGEMTFFHFAGLAPFSPQEWDRILGDWIKLPDR